MREGILSARVIPVIEVSGKVGDGSPDNIGRIVKQYWDLDGKLLAEKDKWLEQKEAEKKSDFTSSFTMDG